MNQDQSGSSSGAGRVAVTMTSFADYLVAPAAERLACVQQLREMYGSPYDPVTNFYHAFRRGVIDGRRSGNDQLTLQRVLSEQRNPTRATPTTRSTS